MMKRVLMAVALAASVVAAPAQAMNGRDLYEASKHFTEAGNDLDGAFYLGYVSSTADTMKDKLCFPSDLVYARIASSIKPFLKEHAELSDQPAMVVVYLALQDKYACKGFK